jgi:hypothetical protein
MNKIVFLVSLAISLKQYSCCFGLLNNPCFRLIGAYSLEVNSSPTVFLYFNDASNKLIDSRIKLAKTTGRFSFYLINSLVNASRSGFDFTWKDGNNYELSATSSWKITCYQNASEFSLITFQIPVCAANFPKTQVQVEITIDSNAPSNHDAGSLNAVIDNVTC